MMSILHHAMVTKVMLLCNYWAFEIFNSHLFSQAEIPVSCAPSLSPPSFATCSGLYHSSLIFVRAKHIFGHIMQTQRPPTAFAQ